MIQEGLVSFLADLVTLYPVVVPAGADRPCATYQLVSSVGDTNHDGSSKLVTSRYQLTIHANSYPAAAELARSIWDRLDDHRGALGASGESVNHITAERPHDLGYQPDEDSWQMAVDALIQHVEV